MLTQFLKVDKQPEAEILSNFINESSTSDNNSDNNNNLIKVYLENNCIKLFKYDSNTSVRDVLMCLKEKMNLKNIDYYGLCVRASSSSLTIRNSNLFYLEETRLLYEVIKNLEKFNTIQFVFRIIFRPQRFDILLYEDLISFNYLYQQVNIVK
jgi:hypothetical protein